MRSYKEHLISVGSATTTKPIFRASGIFPVFHEKDFSSRLIFMGYWMLKRGVSSLSAVATLRSAAGAILDRTMFTIDEARAWRLEVAEALAKSGWDLQTPFFGSMEIEFFSIKNLVFPFPAVVVNYYGPHFSTMVHTAQRVFNDFEDINNVMKSIVPESGFNLIVDENTEPFITMINGPQNIEHAEVEFTFYNQQKETLHTTWSLRDLTPYQTVIIHPQNLIDLNTFLGGEPGTAKIKFHLPWTFPRLIVGNRHHEPKGAVITHTYYDCSEAQTEGDYWYSSEEGWHDATLGIPVLVDGEHSTKISLYPIYTPSSFMLSAEFYDQQGKKLGEDKELLHITSTTSSFHQSDIKEIMLRSGINTHSPCTARIIATATGEKPIPARIKVAVDIGAKKHLLPCNICTNLVPFNPKVDHKPQTFRWLPLVEQPGASAWVINSGQKINYTREAHVTLTFYREQDCQTLIRTSVIPPHGFLLIERDQDKELQEFLGQGTGWLTVVADNPYILTYYFADHRSGIVGGDHGF